MPHQRKRYAQSRLEAALRSSPIVGLLGHRQTGKTTLLAQLKRHYFSLDQRLEREKLEKNPEAYLQKKNRGTVAFDECQWAPDLFPALKDAVRRSSRPGQFLLSGSVRFTSRKSIRESLAGRLLLIELLPFGLKELLGDSLSPWPLRLLEMTDFSGIPTPEATPARVHNDYIKQLELYLQLGGLPGVCLHREDADRTARHEDLLDLILDRDLRLIFDTQLPLARIRGVLKAFAEASGTPLNLTDIHREARVSLPTLRKLLAAFEALFLIRLHPTEGGRASPVLWFEDLGEWSRLTGRPASLEHFIFSQIRLPFAYTAGQRVEFFQYRTRGGALIPVCLRTTQGTLGFMAVTEQEISKSELFSAQSFLKHAINSKVIFLHRGRDWRKISSRLMVAPISAF